MELFANKFEELGQALESGNTEKLKEMMRLSPLRRSYFDKQQ